MKLSRLSISGIKIGMKLGLWFALLLAVILSMFVVTQLSGMSNDSKRIDADLASNALVNTINSLAKENGIFSMGIRLSEDGYPYARIIALTDQHPGQALHGWCQLRGQHLSAG